MEKFKREIKVIHGAQNIGLLKTHGELIGEKKVFSNFAWMESDHKPLLSVLVK